MKWNKQIISIPHQNRFIEAIMHGDIIILDCANFSHSFIENLILSHNEAVVNEYKRGLNDGLEIAKEAMKGVLQS